jgi:hypothetical protein
MNFPANQGRTLCTASQIEAPANAVRHAGVAMSTGNLASTKI